MLIKVFSLTFDSVRASFNDEPLRDFLKDKEVVSISDHFFIKNEVPYLTVVVKYFLYKAESQLSVPSSTQNKRDESWKDLLEESDIGKFDLLREWRTKRCREDGVPPYVLFTNKQLAQIVKDKPISLSNLGQIEGIGDAKIGKYGKELLEITTTF